jgi:phosphatidylserine synthase
LDRKEVSRRKPRAARRPGREAAAKGTRLWQPSVRLVVYGAIFALGFWALMLVLAGNLLPAGRIILAAAVLAHLEFSLRRPPAAPSPRLEEFASLSDLLCFSAAPGFLFYRLLLKDLGLMGVGAVFVIIFAGVLRLSLYKIYHPGQGPWGFIGIPLAMTAAGIGLMAQVAAPEQLQPALRTAFLALAGLLAFLNVSTIRYPRFGAGLAWSAPLVLALAAVLWGPPVARPAVWLLLGAGTAYTIFAPLGARERR